MRNAFFNALTEAAADDRNIMLLVGDLGYSVVEPFIKQCPDQFVNVGIAEQNMAGIATGLALCGKTVFVYSIANFPTFRCLEQIRNDICYHEANVKIIAVGGGLSYGAQGMTHHAVEDIAIMRALPNMIVTAPGDPMEAAVLTKLFVSNKGPCYMRLGKAGEPCIHKKLPDLAIGKSLVLLEGKDVTLVSTGGMLHNTIEAAKLLSGCGIESTVMSMPTIKPLDVKAICNAALKTKCIITIEEHRLNGGLGTAVIEALNEDARYGVPVLRIALKDSFITDVGSQEYLLSLNKLSIGDITEQVKIFYTSLGQ